MFKKQPEWASHHAPQPELIAVYLKAMGIPEKRLEKTYLIEKHREKIELDRADGVKAGVRMTPTFFVNGMMLGEIGYRPLKNAIDRAQVEKQVRTDQPTMYDRSKRHFPIRRNCG